MERNGEMHYFYLKKMETRNKNAVKQLKNRTTETTNQGIRTFMTGTRKNSSDYSGFIKRADGTIPDVSCSVRAIN